MKQSMLSTRDNPFNPFTEWEDWFAYDIQKNYNTPGLLDRLTMNSNSLTDEENSYEINKAIDDWLELVPDSMHIKVTSDE